MFSIGLFQPWRLHLRVAEEAARAGRLREAARLVIAHKLIDFLPGQRLATRLAAELTQHAERLAEQGDVAGGWHAYRDAKVLHEDSPELPRTLRKLVAAELPQLEQQLARREAAACLARLTELEQWGVPSGELAAIRASARQLRGANRWLFPPTATTTPADEPPARGPRFRLWVDGVGGYLVCLAPRITLGQAAVGNLVDVPIHGDLARRHAALRREGEGYIVEAWQPVRVNGRPVEQRGLLADGDEVELGSSVRFRFSKPHALSASARLTRLSRHRTEPYADGVLWMAESCVLGPRVCNHVVCPDWADDLVLFRQQQELYCRSQGQLEIDGGPPCGKGRLPGNARIVGPDFSLTIEELDRCQPQPLL